MLGNPRIMHGGRKKTPVVDIGAIEYYVNQIQADPSGWVTLTWSSLAGKNYRVERSSDMFTWETAADNVPSLGDTVTTWTDVTAPFTSPAVRMRYYRIVEW